MKFIARLWWRFWRMIHLSFVIVFGLVTCILPGFGALVFVGWPAWLWLKTGSYHTPSILEVLGGPSAVDWIGLQKIFDVIPLWCLLAFIAVFGFFLSIARLENYLADNRLENEIWAAEDDDTIDR